MGYACLCIQTAGDHLFWEQGMLGKKRSQGSKVKNSGWGCRGYVYVCTPRFILTHWGALEQFILGEVFAEDKATISTNRPGLLHFHHELMVLHTPL